MMSKKQAGGIFAPGFFRFWKNRHPDLVFLGQI